MASNADFLAHYGWAFAGFRDAREQVDKAPEHLRSDLRWALEVEEQRFAEDLKRAATRAGESARRLGSIASSATADTAPREKSKP